MKSGYSLENRSERAMNYSKAAGEATFRVGPLVKLARREPDDLAPYRRYFPTALYFNSTECTTTFPNKYLKQNPPSADVLLYKYLEQEARQLHDLQHHEMLEELSAALRRGLLTEQYAARHIADLFGLHERTLHRRLRAAGTNFRRELDLAQTKHPTLMKHVLSGWLIDLTHLIPVFFLESSGSYSFIIGM